MSNGTKVQKRDGRIESLDLDKMHLMVEEACKGLAGVSASQVEMKSGIQFYSGISTGEIQEILIRSASDLIDLDHPNYQYVAARLLLFSVRKSTLWQDERTSSFGAAHLYDCVNNEVYDNDIFNKYSKEEIEKADSYIDHDRDYAIHLCRSTSGR
jgi:ribonucleoside-diphosphate reductase alpha chain